MIVLETFDKLLYRLHPLNYIHTIGSKFRLGANYITILESVIEVAERIQRE